MSYDVREKTEVPKNFGKDSKKSKFPYKSGNGWWCEIREKRGRMPLARKPRK